MTAPDPRIIRAARGEFDPPVSDDREDDLRFFVGVRNAVEAMLYFALAVGLIVYVAVAWFEPDQMHEQQVEIGEIGP